MKIIKLNLGAKKSLILIGELSMLLWYRLTPSNKRISFHFMFLVFLFFSSFMWKNAHETREIIWPSQYDSYDFYTLFVSTTR